jgi:hypothetical protein
MSFPNPAKALNRYEPQGKEGEDSACYPLPDREYPERRGNRIFLISENKRGPAMQGNGLAGSSTRLSLVPRTAWCYEQTNEATDQPSGGNAPPDGVIQWAERLWLVPEQKKMNIAPVLMVMLNRIMILCWTVTPS